MKTRIKGIAVLLMVSISASAFGASPVQRRFLHCLRSLVEESGNNRPTETDPEYIEPIYEILENLEDRGAFTNDRELLKGKLAQCRDLRKNRTIRIARTDLFPERIRTFLNSAAGQDSAISPYTLRMVRSFSDVSHQCIGGLVTATVAVGVGGTVGVGSHLCKFSDGRQGLYFGPNAGWGVGIGAGVSILSGPTYVVDLNKNGGVDQIEVEYLTGVLGSLVEIPVDEGGGITAGILLMKKLTIGREVRLIPLPNAWDWVLKQAGYLEKPFEPVFELD
ncbi:MAG: hypothetical protein AAB425_01825 [Bdellovibrionota bacterium]